MTWQTFLPHLLVMALVTYLIRMLPLTLMRRQIHNRFIRSFLKYVPYAVLSAMTFPDILFSTGYTAGTPNGLITALVGLVAAAIAAWRGKELLTVAIVACLAVAAAQFALLLIA
ncbi:MAG: AzlD domain-containing protein [Clostridia bacterium]|nr:AzlD domain-containing protein [Clostridia bacterium]MBR1686592.1 AzlD domain-containing protein [Clostridia bacterium]MBR2288496.1 AzlD domain-containing protein [Clostridia bacterium]